MEINKTIITNLLALVTLMIDFEKWSNCRPNVLLGLNLLKCSLYIILYIPKFLRMKKQFKQQGISIALQEFTGETMLFAYKIRNVALEIVKLISKMI